MHREALEFIRIVKDEFPYYFIGQSVLEIGSFNVNGTVRSEFDLADYTGVDLIEGPGVDIVSSGHEIKLGRVFNVVISMECMEHNPHHIETIENMFRHCSNDGVVIISTATLSRPEHGTNRTSPAESPGTSAMGWEYYKNIRISNIITTLVGKTGFNFRCYYNYISNDLYILAIGPKSPDSERSEEKFHSIQQHLNGSQHLSSFEKIIGGLQYFANGLQQNLKIIDSRLSALEKNNSMLFEKIDALTEALSKHQQ